jgi:hypothetical protein
MPWARLHGVSAAPAHLARERILWVERQTVSQSARSDRSLDSPAVRFERML